MKVCSGGVLLEAVDERGQLCTPLSLLSPDLSPFYSEAFSRTPALSPLSSLSSLSGSSSVRCSIHFHLQQEGSDPQKRE